MAGLGENKLAQVWETVLHFSMSCFRRVVNDTLNRILFGVRYEEHIS